MSYHDLSHNFQFGWKDGAVTMYVDRVGATASTFEYSLPDVLVKDQPFENDSTLKPDRIEFVAVSSAERTSSRVQQETRKPSVRAQEAGRQRG